LLGYPVLAGISSALLNLFIIRLALSSLSPAVIYPVIAVGGMIVTILFSVTICREKLNGNFKFALSHSSESWCNIENVVLCEKIGKIVKNEIKDSIYNHKLSKFIEPKVKRLVELKNNKDIKEFTCLDGDKKTFYRGNFLEIPCILYSDKNILNKNNYKKCLSCDYKKICTKSCYYECINGEVPEKLCLIEKIQFDILMSYFFVNNIIKRN
jgi:hypothetical protein